MNNLIEKVTNLANVTLIKTKKYSPEILLGVGIISAVGAVALAIYETTKVEEILDAHEEIKENIDSATESGEVTTSENVVAIYTSEDRKKDLTTLYLRTGWEFVKLYAPSFGLTALAVTSMLYSHGIMKSRNVAVTAAYNSLAGAFRKYRDGVIERYGSDIDKDLKAGRYYETVETEAVENGKKKKKKETVSKYKDPSEYSDFARFFDDFSCYYHKNSPEMNLMFLKSQQEYATRLLRARGHLFLNEVYDMLDIPRTPEGQAVGWVMGAGDDFVDFGIYDGYSKAAREFVRGDEPAILLDFNIDGVIWDKIWTNGPNSIGTGNPIQDSLDYYIPYCGPTKVIIPSETIVPCNLEDWEDTDKYIKE